MPRKPRLTSKIKAKFVKFSPEEMAYDPSPEETENWTFVGCGPEAVFAKPAGATNRPAAQTKPRPARMTAKQGYVKLAPDVRKAFPTDASVNTALRSVMKRRSRKTA